MTLTLEKINQNKQLCNIRKYMKNKIGILKGFHTRPGAFNGGKLTVVLEEYTGSGIEAE